MNKLKAFLLRFCSSKYRFNDLVSKSTSWSKKKIIYIDLDGVCANYKKLYLERLQKDPENKFPQASYGFFMEMEEIEDAVATVKELAKHYDVWFLSAPSHRNPMCLAEKNYWVRIHFGPEWPERLILANDKSLLRGDYLIDDNLTGRNQENFKGKFIHFANGKTWKDVLEFFMFEMEYDLQKQQPKKLI